ncbi:hypothetical protein V1281_001765 [Nitrobacteraceae bacterium AZCC 2161]
MRPGLGKLQQMKFSIVSALSGAPLLFVRAVIILPLALSACATQPQALWLKPGAATEEFGQDKYGCMQQSQQPNSTAYANRYGGVANSSVITNGSLYDACMNSKGWVLTPVTDVKGFNDAMRPIGEEARAICSKDEFQSLYRKKMSCKAIDTTPDQISDRAKVSSEEKAALAKWLEAIQAFNDKVAVIHRQYNPKSGDAVASVVESGAIDTRKLVMELASGTISWGEYNRRRVELAKRMQESTKIALTY